MRRQKSAFVLVVLGMAVIIGLGHLAAAKAEAAKTIKWKLSLWGGPRAWTRSIETWAEDMKRQTNGRFEVEIFYGQALSPARENLDGLRSGMFQAAAVCPFYTPGKIPLNQVLDLPFLPPQSNEDLVRFQAAAWDHPAVRAELAKWNTVPLLPSIPPQYEIMGKKRIAKVEDFKGVRIAGMSADMGKVFAKYGAVPTPMPAPELYNSLERGVIDVIIFPWTYAYGAYKLHEVSKYVTTGVSAGSPSAFYLANKKAYDALPDDIKKLIQEHYRNWPKKSAKVYAAADAKWIPIFKKKLEWTELPGKERDKLESKARAVWDEWVNEWKDRGPTREILDYMLKKRKEITGK